MVDAVLWYIQTETAGVSKDCYFRTAAVLHTELEHTFGRKVSEIIHIRNCMKIFRNTTPGTRPGSEPTTGKQYSPSSRNKPGTAAEVAAGGKT